MRDRNRASSAADGSFEIRGVNPGRFTLEARRGQDTGQAPGILLEPGDVRDVDIELEPGVVIAGRIISEEGNLVENAQISATELPRYVSRDVKGDADGRYRVDGLLPGLVAVTIRAQGFIELEAKLEARPGTTTRDWVLPRGESLRGTVLDVESQPLRGAEIHASPRVHFYSHGEATTDERGVFTLSGLSPDDYELFVTKDQATVISSAKVVVTANMREELLLRQERPGEISGTVRYADGSSTEGAHVAATVQWVATTAPIGADGSYKLSGVPVGEIDVAVRPRSVLPYSSFTRGKEHRSVTVKAGAPVSHVDFVLEKPAAPIRGVVVHSDGSPAPRVQVTGGDCRFHFGLDATETDGNGAFVIDGDETPTDVCAFPPTRPARIVKKVAAGTTDLRIVLEPGFAIAGTVIRSDGKPVSHAFIHVESQARDDRQSPVDATTNDDGSFELAALAGGTYRVEARTFDGLVGEVNAIALDRDRRDLRVSIEGGASVRGRTIDAHGAPLVNAVVDIGNAHASTASDGTFTVSGLPPGDAHILISPPGGAMFDVRTCDCAPAWNSTWASSASSRTTRRIATASWASTSTAATTGALR
jgi:hypothetical protein